MKYLTLLAVLLSACTSDYRVSVTSSQSTEVYVSPIPGGNSEQVRYAQRITQDSTVINLTITYGQDTIYKFNR